MSRVSLLLLLLLGATQAGCGVGYVWQGALGQLDLLSSAHEISDVVEDPATSPQTRLLLDEVGRIKSYGVGQGLRLSGNYEEYVPQTPERDPNYVVWFVNASEPLAFVPKVFSFPVVGSFPGLSWFDQEDANEFADELRAEGWDVNVRGVSAYSTGGWFDDPILWTMFADGENAFGSLTNVILHESVHATVLVPGQQYFNESLASFVADGMSPQYLSTRFGSDSSQLRTYVERRSLYLEQMGLLVSAYEKLDRLYQSSVTTSRKLRRKREIFDSLRRQLQTDMPLNNATLIGVQLYRVASDEFQALFESCGRSWPHFLRATGSLMPDHFAEEQQADFGSVLTKLTQRGCRPWPKRRSARVLVAKPELQRRERGTRLKYATP